MSAVKGEGICPGRTFCDKEVAFFWRGSDHFSRFGADVFHGLTLTIAVLMVQFGLVIVSLLFLLIIFCALAMCFWVLLEFCRPHVC